MGCSLTRGFQHAAALGTTVGLELLQPLSYLRARTTQTAESLEPPATLALRPERDNRTKNKQAA